MSGYGWMAVKGNDPDLFIDESAAASWCFIYRDEPAVEHCSGVGVAELSSGWMLLFIRRDWIDDAGVYVARFSPQSKAVVVNTCDTSMGSNFRYYNNGKLLCHVEHDGGNDLNHLEITGRLPTGGRAIVNAVKAKQKGQTDCDYLWDIPSLLGDLMTGYRYEADIGPTSGFRLLGVKSE